jgi:hypothetical protein
LYVPEGNYYYQKALDLLNAALLDSIVFSMFNFVFDLDSNNTANIGNGTGKVFFKKKDKTQHDFQSIELNFQAPPLVNQFASKVVSIASEVAIYDKKSNIPFEQRFGWMLGFRNGKYINNQNYVSVKLGSGFGFYDKEIANYKSINSFIIKIEYALEENGALSMTTRGSILDKAWKEPQTCLTFGISYNL